MQSVAGICQKMITAGKTFFVGVFLVNDMKMSDVVINELSTFLKRCVLLLIIY